MLHEQGTFTHGIIVKGKAHKAFTLHEEVMRHTFLVSEDFTLDRQRLSGDEKEKVKADPAYFAACIMAARLTVDGIDKVTPEMVEVLPKADAQTLFYLSAQLENRRELFRTETEAAADGPAGAAETGVSGGGNSDQEPG